MRPAPYRRIAAALAAAALAAVAYGCGTPFGQRARSELMVPLRVRNHGIFDVTVELLQSSGTRGRRVATVTGYSSVTVGVRQRELQPGGLLAVRLHAIGSNSSWESPSIAVGPDVTAYLDIHATRNGDLGRSSLWATPMESVADTVPLDTAAVGVAARIPRTR